MEEWTVVRRGWTLDAVEDLAVGADVDSAVEGGLVLDPGVSPGPDSAAVSAKLDCAEKRPKSAQT